MKFEEIDIAFITGIIIGILSMYLISNTDELNIIKYNKETKVKIESFEFILKNNLNGVCIHDDACGCTLGNGTIYINSKLSLKNIYRTCIHELCHNFIGNGENIMRIYKTNNKTLEKEIEEKFCEGIDDFGRFYICDELIEKLKGGINE